MQVATVLMRVATGRRSSMGRIAESTSTTTDGMPGVPAVARAAQAVRARSWNWGRRGVGIVTVLLATFALAAVPLAEAMPSGARAEASVPAPPTIPDVGCAPGDSPETGLQGQVPVADRAAGFKGFSCNLKLLGQFPGPGGTWVGSWAGSCAYNATKGNGVIVIDASDPAHPRATATLTSPAMMHTWESLKYNPRRQLLAATSFDDQYFDVYDVSDCRHPQLRASIALGSEAHGHAGNFTPDGLTYYSSQMFRGLGGIMPVIDVSDPSDPQHLLDWQFSGNGRPHDISFNEDGTRAYAMQPGQFESTTFPGPNGLVILDVSDIQFRRPNPQINVISTLFWEDSGQAQQSLPVTFHGRPYLITTDELGAGGVEGRQGACARGLSPFGFARIIDISNELNPKIVSKLELRPTTLRTVRSTRTMMPRIRVFSATTVTTATSTASTTPPCWAVHTSSRGCASSTSATRATPRRSPTTTRRRGRAPHRSTLPSLPPAQSRQTGPRPRRALSAARSGISSRTTAICSCSSPMGRP